MSEFFLQQSDEYMTAQLNGEHTLLELCEVSRTFSVKNGLFGEKKSLKAVDRVSLTLHEGECVGLVGESGCGKSTLGKLACGLLAPSRGEVRFMNRPLPLAGAGSWAAGKIQMVFQDPYSSLNPRMTVAASVAEPLLACGVKQEERLQRAQDMLRKVGLSAVGKRYPHEFSGGQRQRIVVARALITKPSVIICDEPVSALDASVQAQVINLLLDMQDAFGFAYLFISHDLNVVGFLCDRIVVMYLGRIVEEGPKERIFENPLHPYTKALLSARAGEDGERYILQGELPSPVDLPKGCAFHPRCPKANDICLKDEPDLRLLDHAHHVRCHLI